MVTPANDGMRHRQFLKSELRLLTIAAALATRDNRWRVYKRSAKPAARDDARNRLREILIDIECKYAERILSEDKHIKFIESTAKTLSKDLGAFLRKGRFRIGIAQKLINLHLKYLWCAGLIEEPPHCPIDGRIRDIAGIAYNWTRSDDITEYKAAIKSLRAIANAKKMRVAAWELAVFNRRAGG
jgi:hypothetical protein